MRIVPKSQARCVEITPEAIFAPPTDVSTFLAGKAMHELEEGNLDLEHTAYEHLIRHNLAKLGLLGVVKPVKVISKHNKLVGNRLLDAPEIFPHVDHPVPGFIGVLMLGLEGNLEGTQVTNMINNQAFIQHMLELDSAKALGPDLYRVEVARTSDRSEYEQVVLKKLASKAFRGYLNEDQIQEIDRKTSDLSRQHTPKQISLRPLFIDIEPEPNPNTKVSIGATSWEHGLHLSSATPEQLEALPDLFEDITRYLLDAPVVDSFHLTKGSALLIPTGQSHFVELPGAKNNRSAVAVQLYNA